MSNSTYSVLPPCVKTSDCVESCCENILTNSNGYYAWLCNSYAIVQKNKLVNEKTMNILQRVLGNGKSLDKEMKDFTDKKISLKKLYAQLRVDYFVAALPSSKIALDIVNLMFVKMTDARIESDCKFIPQKPKNRFIARDWDRDALGDVILKDKFVKLIEHEFAIALAKHALSAINTSYDHGIKQQIFKEFHPFITDALTREFVAELDDNNENLDTDPLEDKNPDLKADNEIFNMSEKEIEKRILDNGACIIC